MNLFDLLLLLVVGVALVGGWRVGLVARVSTWLGLAAGVLLSTWTVPAVLGVVDVDAGGGLLRLAVGLLVLAFTVSMVASVFQAVGARLRHAVARTPLSGVDRGAGALLGGAAVVAVVWFLLPTVAEVPGTVARQVRTSTAVTAMRDLTPPPPDASHALRALVHSSRFPEVFADLEPGEDHGPPPESVPVSDHVVDRVTASTVNVEASGCGRRYEGSGFAVGTDRIVTNAHVVAGADTVIVKRPDGEQRDAVVVVFDPDRDLAVLEVDDLGQASLPLADPVVGDEVVTVGYPGGQDHPRVASARIDERRTALGNDIYGLARTERDVLFLSAALEQGDSGSPVVDAEGNVAGVVFAISPDQPSTAYAVDLAELTVALDAPALPGEAGACL